MEGGTTSLVAFVLIVSYLLGSIPFAFIIAKKYGINIMETGSGNVGATNTYRVLGKGVASTVFLMDVLKGALSIVIAQTLLPSQSIWILLAGFLSVFGHSVSIFLGFKGGKGVATTVGVVGVLSIDVLVVGIFIFLLVFLFFRVISLASMSACLSLSLVSFFLAKPLSYVYFNLILAIYIIFLHRSNIARFIRGDEARLSRFQ